MFTDSLILTLTKKEHDFNSHQKQKRHEFGRHLLLQHPKPFLLDLLFFGASKQVHRRYDVFIKARPDAVYLLEVPPLWQFNLSNLVFPAGALAAFFSSPATGRCRSVLFQCRSGDKTTCNWCRISFHQLYFSVGEVIKYLPLTFVAGILFRTKPCERTMNLWIWNLIGALVIARKLID